MDIPIDQDQHWLIDCLKASMEPCKDRRSFAEISLHQAALQPGLWFFSTDFFKQFSPVSNNSLRYFCC